MDQKLFEGLTSEQSDVLTSMLNGNNIFLSGNAGTGKSYVLNRYLEHMRNETEKNIIVCATTGIASLLINGTTLHRAFQLKVGDTKFYLTDARDINPTKEVSQADIIVIDEISMCNYEVFRYVAWELMNAKNKDHHIKQLIVVGDFFQLPPVVRRPNKWQMKNRDEDEISDYEIYAQKFEDYGDGWCFNTKEWEMFQFQSFNLTQVLRQHDNQFIDNLNKARIGDYSCLPYFNQKVTSKEKLDLTAIQVVGTNKAADQINTMRLDEIESEEVEFHAKSKGEVKTADKPVPDIIRLKVGARVMAVMNDPDGEYQNGSLGTVLEIDTHSILVDFDNGNIVEIARCEWKIQRPSVVKKKVNGVSVEMIEMEEIGKYTQVPLKLAYAITIHKSQGQTYNKLVLTPESFENGQLYVALSRVTSIEGLQLTERIQPQDLRCSQEVKNFYRKLNRKDGREVSLYLSNECIDKMLLLEKKSGYSMEQQIEAFVKKYYTK